VQTAEATSVQIAVTATDIENANYIERWER